MCPARVKIFGQEVALFFSSVRVECESKSNYFNDTQIDTLRQNNKPNENCCQHFRLLLLFFFFYRAAALVATGYVGTAEITEWVRERGRDVNRWRENSKKATLRWKLSENWILYILFHSRLFCFFVVCFHFAHFHFWANWVEDGSSGVFNTWSVCNCHYYANFPFPFLHCMRVFPGTRRPVSRNLNKRNKRFAQ